MNRDFSFLNFRGLVRGDCGRWPTDGGWWPNDRSWQSNGQGRWRLTDMGSQRCLYPPAGITSFVC